MLAGTYSFPVSALDAPWLAGVQVQLLPLWPHGLFLFGGPDFSLPLKTPVTLD